MLVLAEVCKISACCADATVAIAMMLAMPFVRADVVLANKFVSDLICLHKERWDLVCGNGEE